MTLPLKLQPAPDRLSRHRQNESVVEIMQHAIIPAFTAWDKLFARPRIRKKEVVTRRIARFRSLEIVSGLPFKS